MFEQSYKINFIKNKNLQQLFGYLISGAIATITHYTILIFLVEKLTINPLVASSFGFLAGAFTGFNLNKYFVFCDPNACKIACCKYVLMAGIGAILNITLLNFLINIVNFHYLLAQTLATISIVIGNFLCCKLWIFKA